MGTTLSLYNTSHGLGPSFYFLLSTLSCCAASLRNQRLWSHPPLVSMFIPYNHIQALQDLVCPPDTASTLWAVVGTQQQIWLSWINGKGTNNSRRCQPQLGGSSVACIIRSNPAKTEVLLVALRGYSQYMHGGGEERAFATRTFLVSEQQVPSSTIGAMGR